MVWVARSVIRVVGEWWALWACPAEWEAGSQDDAGHAVSVGVCPVYRKPLRKG